MVVVELAPINTWFVVVPRRIPLPLKKFQSRSSPPLPPVSSVPQTMFPLESVSSVLDPLQLCSLSSLIVPLASIRPFPKVEVADVDWTSRVSAASPAENVLVELVPVTSMNPAKVLVAVVLVAK